MQQSLGLDGEGTKSFDLCPKVRLSIFCYERLATITERPEGI